MHISCEKCATTYVLDDSLIPPQGAPVQCTQCGHVFTARPPARDLTATVAGAPDWEQRPSSGGPANRTMAFGAPKPTAEALQGNPNKTMAFGAPKPTAEALQGNPNKTMAFGAPKPTAEALQGNPNRTMAFGAPKPAAEALQGNPNKTMAFGAPAPTAEALQGNPNRTMAFGAPKPAAAAPPRGNLNKTMAFGAVKPAAGPAPESGQPEQAGRQTMMFGRPPKPTEGADPETPVPESTVRVDLNALLRGQGGDGDVETPARHDQTQRYAMSGAAPAGNQTKLFGGVGDARGPGRGLESTQPPAFSEMPTLEPDGPAAAVNQTLMFGARGGQFTQPAAGSASAMGEPTDPLARSLPAPDEGTSPNVPLVGDREDHLDTLPLPSGAVPPSTLPPLRADLPPEPAFASGFDAPLAAPPLSDDAEVAELRRSGNRRTAIAVIFFLVIALGLGLAVLYNVFGKALLQGQVDTPPSGEVEAAIARLRMDDRESRQKSIKELEAVVAARPDFIEARAGLVLALAFAYDDALVLLDAQRDLLRFGRSSDDAVANARATATAAEAPLKDALSALEAAPAPAPGTPAALAKLRASAVALGVLADPTALGQDEAFRQASKTPDDWLDLAMPEYVATSGSPNPAALTQLDAIAARPANSTFFRVLVLKARLLMKAGEVAQAEEALKTVTTLNSRHEVAAVLLERLTAAGEAQESAARKPGLDR